MGYTIPVKVYEKLEEKLGKETASIVVETPEKSIDETIKESKENLKIVISEELKKELATKYDLKLVETELRKEIDLLREEMHKEIDLVRKDMKIMELRIIAILIIAMLLLNQNSLEFIARLLGLMK